MREPLPSRIANTPESLPVYIVVVGAEEIDFWQLDDDVSEGGRYIGEQCCEEAGSAGPIIRY